MTSESPVGDPCNCSTCQSSADEWCPTELWRRVSASDDLRETTIERARELGEATAELPD